MPHRIRKSVTKIAPLTHTSKYSRSIRGTSGRRMELGLCLLKKVSTGGGSGGGCCCLRIPFVLASLLLNVSPSFPFFLLLLLPLPFLHLLLFLPFLPLRLRFGSTRYFRSSSRGDGGFLRRLAQHRPYLRGAEAGMLCF